MEELLSDAVIQSSEFILDSYALSRTKCRVVLLIIIYIYIARFDSISDLIAWGSFLKVGFAHPLLPTPLLWSMVWGLFALAGLALAMMSTSHEIMKLFHLKGSFCRTHVELMPVAGLLLEDVPMLVLASLYGLSQYTCSTKSIIASSDALVPILISSIGTALATFWRLMLTLLRFRDQGGKMDGERATRISANCRNINSNSSYADKHKGSSTLETQTQKVTESSSNVEGTHKQRHTNTRCQRSHCTHRCSLRQLLQICYKIFISLFGLAICILSILVVAGVTYLMVEQNPLFVHRRRDPLVIFAPSDSSPLPHPLANISYVIDNDRVTLTYENRCLLVFQYKATQHKVV